MEGGTNEYAERDSASDSEAVPLDNVNNERAMAIETQRPIKRMSCPFYLASWLIGTISSFYLLTMRTGYWDGAPIHVSYQVNGLAICASIYTLVVWLVFTYRMWSHLPASYARSSPGKALGFLFIPVFGLYWIFQAYWGWMKDYNRMVEVHRLKLRRMPSGLAMTMCIVDIVAIFVSQIPLILDAEGIAVPGVFWGLRDLMPVAVTVLTALFIGYVCEGINALADIQSGPLDRMHEVPLPALHSTTPKERKPISSLAVTGFVLSLFGLLASFLATIPALILGILGLKKISQEKMKYRGKGFAVASIVIAIVTTPIMPAFLVPELMHARARARDAAAMSNLRSITTAAVAYEIDQGTLPPPHDWVNALREGHLPDIDRYLRWPGEQASDRVWAMNRHLSGLSLQNISNANWTVMFFEVHPGSPLSGGRELLPVQPRAAARTGYMVAFANGTIRCISARFQKDRIIWDPNIEND